MVFLTYGNEDEKAILLYLSESALSISSILEKIKLPQSTCYRLIHSLIMDGFLEVTESKENIMRKTSVYKPSLPQFNIRIENPLSM